MSRRQGEYITGDHGLASEKSQQIAGSAGDAAEDCKPEPRFSDMDARVRAMKSVGRTELPPTDPDSIDESTGMLAKKYPVFKGADPEALLEDVRRR